MTIYTISDDLLLSPQVEQYFRNGDRRIKAGLRATLEILRIPLPAYAERLQAGPRSQGGMGVTARYAKDNPAPRPMPVLHDRKPSATPEVVQAAKAERSGSLFSDTFGSAKHD